MKEYEMKLLMLCREPRLYSCQRLAEAAKGFGIDLDILDPNRFHIKLAPSGTELHYQRGKHFDKKSVNEPIVCLDLMNEYQGVLPRFGTLSTEMGCNVLRQFELAGIVTLNSSAAFRLARDKWQSLQLLHAQGIPIPITVFSGDLFNNRDSVDQFSFPAVIKTLSGSQGVGVMLAENRSSGVSMLDTLRAANIPTLLQQFIAESSGRDIRAFVIGDNVVAAMQRESSTGEFRANIHQGGQAKVLNLTKEDQDLAVQATKALGLDVAGVDLIETHSGLQVLEVNASPGLEMIESVSQIDIANLIIRHLLQKIEEN